MHKIDLDTVSPHVQNFVFVFFHHTLKTILRLKFEEIGVVAQRDCVRAVKSICTQDVDDLKHTLELVSELIPTSTKPGSLRTNAWMSDANANPIIPRPSAFTIALRQCDWALDIKFIFFS